MEQALYRQVRDLVCETLEVGTEELLDSTHFVDDLGIDSILIIELKTQFEEKYDLEIDKSELKNLNSLSEIMSYLTANGVQAV